MEIPGPVNRTRAQTHENTRRKTPDQTASDAGLAQQWGSLARGRGGGGGMEIFGSPLEERLNLF